MSDTINVVCGDALETMRRLPAGAFDLVVTSPPYNLGGRPWPHLGNWKPGDSAGGRSKWRNGSDAGNGIQYDDHEDAIPWPEYVAWQRACLSEMWRAVGDRGAIFYNHKPRVIGAKLWTPQELVPPEVETRQIVVWARAGGLNFNPTAYLPTHEWIMVFAKPGFRLKSKGASGVGDVWTIPQEANPLHPAPFPVALPRRAIETTGAKSVLDPFAGSGSTLIAALHEGVRALGIEKSADYCAAIRQRLAEARGEGRGGLFAAVQPSLFDSLTESPS